VSGEEGRETRGEKGRLTGVKEICSEPGKGSLVEGKGER